MSTPLETPISPYSLATGREPGLTAMAVGRLFLGIVSLASPRAMGRAIGQSATPESTYLARVYGARALAMGTAFLTSRQPERSRWTRLSFAIDVSDTAAGINHLVRRDASLRATITMITITACYAVLGALHLIGGGRGGRSR